MIINQTELTSTNFFRYYLFHTDAKELTSQEKCRAKVWAVFAFVLSFFIIPIICRIALYDVSFQIKKSHPKVTKVADPILNPTKENPKIEIDEDKEDYDVMHTSFEEEIESQPSLPPVLKFVPEKETPLEAGVRAECFDFGMKTVDVRKITSMITSPASTPIDQAWKSLRLNEDSFSDMTKDKKILDIPIAHWIDQEGIGKESKAIINNPVRSAMKKLIDAQLNEWDKELQIKERIKRKKESPTWTVKQLLVCWEYSSLKYSLMTNEELSQLKVKDMSAIDETLFVKANGLRLTQLSRKNQNEKNSQVNLTTELLLTDFYRIKADQFHQFIDDQCVDELPAMTLLLLPRKEIKFLDMKKMSNYHLTFLTSKKELVQRLTATQVKECFLKTDSKIIREKLVSNLNEKQILDFDDTLLDQKLFDIMFEKGPSYVTPSAGDKALSQMPLDQIYKLQKFFAKKHWAKLTDKQVQELDFSKIEKKKEVFESLFDTTPSVGNVHVRFPQQPIERIMALSQYFSTDHWFYFCRINEIDKLKYDFSKIAKAKEAKKFFSDIWSKGNGGKEFLINLTKAQKKIVKPLLPQDAQNWVNSLPS